MRRNSGNRVAMLSAMVLFALAAYADQDADDSKEILVTADTFKCLAEMTPVKHFFVDNLLGNLESTVAVANSDTGGTYPKGSVVQLFPDEIMVKHGEGWNPATRDWEFFEIDVTEEGSTIRGRGFVDVVNRFGGNCFGCHVKARPEWDMICGKDHGCDSIPVTSEEILQLQQADPRCRQDN
jgi:hypothetical protein